MFNNFLFRAFAPSRSDSQMTVRKPLERQVSPNTPDFPVPINYYSGEQMQLLLSEALDGLGIDMQSLPSDWRQRVAIELLKQVNDPQASFQIDPYLLKALLAQLAYQSTQQVVSKAQASFSVAVPAIRKTLAITPTPSFA